MDSKAMTLLFLISLILMSFTNNANLKAKTSFVWDKSGCNLNTQYWAAFACHPKIQSGMSCAFLAGDACISGLCTFKTINGLLKQVCA